MQNRQTNMTSHLHLMLEVLFLILLLMPILHINSFNTNCSAIHGNYTSKSIFQSNLKIVLRTLKSAANSTRHFPFHNVSSGLDENKVYGMYLCRGDITPANCSSCIDWVTTRIVEDCPKQREAIRWVDECMLRYANRDIFSREEVFPALFENQYFGKPPPPPGFRPPPPSPVPFNKTMVIFNLIDEAAFGDYSPGLVPFYATREDNITVSWFDERLYSLAQCTPDLSAELCYSCLTNAYNLLNSCCSANFGSEVVVPSCRARTSIIKFYNGNNSTNRHRSKLSEIMEPPTGFNGHVNNEVDHTKTKESSTSSLVIAIPSVVAGLVVLLGVCLLVKRCNAKPLASNGERDIITIENLEFDATVIKAATNNFSIEHKLGSGKLSSVYKGKLRSGQEIAVKKLSTQSGQTLDSFKTNVQLVTQLQHRNLIRLLGYSVIDEVKILIYELLPNSSLEHYLFNPEKQPSLTWEIRYNIIKGIAKGLLYLHEYSQYTIVHRNLMPSNILLDKNMTAKLSDFGMAEFFGDNQLETMSKRVAGSDGQIAPEYKKSGEFTVKSDVYSFGLLILQIISGQKVGYKFVPNHPAEDLLQRARRLWNSNQALTLIDPSMCGKQIVDEVMQCFQIALTCISAEPGKRPTMAYINSVLNSQLSALPDMPIEGYYRSDMSTDSSSRLEQDQTTSTYSGMHDITTLQAR